MDDPNTYDLSEFALEFTWALLFWNGAEASAKTMLSMMLGDTTAATAVVADMGNRTVLQGLEASARELDDVAVRDHINHFSKGFGVMLGYRNMYVHNLRGTLEERRSGTNVILSGWVMQVKAEGRLKTTQRHVRMSEMTDFKNAALSLSRYATAICSELGMEDYGLSELLGIQPPSLEKPVWPASLQNTPHYLQD